MLSRKLLIKCAVLIFLKKVFLRYIVILSLEKKFQAIILSKVYVFPAFSAQNEKKTYFSKFCSHSDNPVLIIILILLQ